MFKWRFNMNKKIILFLLILVSICAISNVSASDSSDFIALDNSTDIEAQAIDEAIDEDEALKANDEIDDEKLSADADDYRTIQQIIDDADEGDTVYLDGTFICDYLVNVDKTVNIVGRGDGAIIKLSDEYREYNTPFFNVNASDVSLRNVKFMGGLFLFGGAITWQGDNGRIYDCEFSDNIASSTENGIGGAILLMGDNCRLENCIFTNNHAYQHGGAVLWYGDYGTIRDCQFRDNKAYGTAGNKGWGGALMLYADNCLVSNCSFINNSCSDYGGAIATHNNTNRIVNCYFEDNFVINNVTYNDGKSDVQGGGAIFSTCIGLAVDGCNFTNNHADGALGGALSLSINNSVSRSYFKGNKALLGNDILASTSSLITSNHIVLDFNETRTEAIHGITLDDGLFNIFELTKIDSVVNFNAGMVFDYAQSGKVGVIVEGGTLELENIRVLNHPEAIIQYNDDELIVSNLNPGEYTLRATTTPDDLHNAVDADLSITVKKSTATISASKTTVALKKGTLWTIRVIDSKTGKPISKMWLKLKVYTGKKYKTVNVQTDAKGIASYQTKNLAKGSHKIVVSGTHVGYTFNTLTSSINVIKPTALTFKVVKKSAKDGATLSITVKNKATKKPVNGVKVKLLIYTGKTYQTVVLKTKKMGKMKGVCGYGTNTLTVGSHKVVIQPENIKYSGSATSKMVIKKSAKKVLPWTHKTSG
jgi:predicted outer membrane repeat protein